MFQADPQLIDWDLDDEGLLDVCVTSTPSDDTQNTSHCSTDIDARMNPKDLCEYLQPLINRLEEDLISCE